MVRAVSTSSVMYAGMRSLIPSDIKIVFTDSPRKDSTDKLPTNFSALAFFVVSISACLGVLGSFLVLFGGFLVGSCWDFEEDELLDVDEDGCRFFFSSLCPKGSPFA